MTQEDKNDDLYSNYIERIKRKIEYYQKSLDFANNGIQYLEEHKYDFENDSQVIKLSFVEHDFNITNGDCMALLQYIRYNCEQLLSFENRELEFFEGQKDRKDSEYPNISDMLFGTLQF